MREFTCYKIADIFLGMHLTTGYQVLNEDPYKKFEAETKEEHVRIDFHIGENLPAVCGEYIFGSCRNQVYRKGKKLICYAGYFKNPGEEAFGKSCIEWDEEQSNHCKVWLKQEKRDVFEREIFSAMDLTHIMAAYGRVILHASFISYKGEGVLFSAPSGTGKSTQAELWKRNRREVELINGDRSILAFEGEEVWAYGLPFCGSSGVSLNRKVPLRAIAVLRQGRENCIRRIYGGEALRLLLSECSVNQWDKKGLEHILDVLLRLIQQVPVYYFACLPDASAVDVLEQTINGEG